MINKFYDVKLQWSNILHCCSLLLTLEFVFACDAYASVLNTQPYLQNATPKSIWLLWVTDTGNQSRVEYGTSVGVLNSVVDGSVSSWKSQVIHETQINGLNEDTVYYYRVRTDNVISSTYQFRTPPAASAEKSFRFAVISDSQSQYSRLQKQVETINEHLTNEVLLFIKMLIDKLITC